MGRNTNATQNYEKSLRQNILFAAGKLPLSLCVCVCVEPTITLVFCLLVLLSPCNTMLHALVHEGGRRAPPTSCACIHPFAGKA